MKGVFNRFPLFFFFLRNQKEKENRRGGNGRMADWANLIMGLNEGERWLALFLVHLFPLLLNVDLLPRCLLSVEC
jgi:hypothetical protein